MNRFSRSIGVFAGLLALTLFGSGLSLGCGDDDDRCGPRRGVVSQVIDGDTFDLESGERVRLLMVDTPETTGGQDDCFGQEAKDFTTTAILGREVSLTYDTVCEDQYGRLLAYVFVDGRELNTLLVERGYACVMHIPPNGDDRVDEFESLEYVAKTNDVGMWGACTEVTCEN